LLLISLLAQITGVVFFYLDWDSYPTTKPQPPPGLSAPAAPGGGAPVVPGAPGGAGAPK
jgi:hypothetical protein